MQYVLFSNKGSSILAENLLQSMENVGIEKTSIILYVNDDETVKKFLKKEIRIKKTKDNNNIIEYQNWGEKSFFQLVHNKLLSIYDSIEFKDSLYIDTDIVLLRNPKKYLYSLNVDMALQDSSFKNNKNRYCTGFWFIKRTDKNKEILNKVINIHKEFLKYKESFGDEGAFNRIMKTENIQDVKIQLLSRSLFPNGDVFFNRKIDKQEKYLVHANFIIGIDKKIEMLKKHNLWYL